MMCAFGKLHTIVHILATFLFVVAVVVATANAPPSPLQFNRLMLLLRKVVHFPIQKSNTANSSEQ